MTDFKRNRRFWQVCFGIPVLLILMFLFNSNDLPHKNPGLQEFEIDTLATNLVVPWEIAFLPDQTMLFTERSGKVRVYRDNKLVKEPALVLQNLETTKKMGLLGLAIHPEFPMKNYIYLAYNYKEGEQTFLRISRYHFEDDQLVDPQVLIEHIEAGQNHTGSRLVFSPDGHLFITTGDGDNGSLAQDLDKLNGKILRLNDDGSIPKDNPFVSNDNARPEIWTYGHRNTQGLAFQPGTGVLYNSEHGPSGGDEINIIEKGQNYGWPVIHHRDQKEGMKTPLLEYSPSIGPSKILFYTGDIFTQFKGDLFMATLRGENIFQLRFKNEKVQQRKLFQDGEYGRIRAITQGPDGYIYFSTSQVDPPEGKPRKGDDLLLRLRPVKTTRPVEFDQVLETDAIAEKTSKTSKQLYEQLCLSCHGPKLEGTERGPGLVDSEWIYGNSHEQVAEIIHSGVINKGMPAWKQILTNEQIDELTGYILNFDKQ